MVSLVRPLGTFPRFPELQEAVIDLLATHPPINHQLMLQTAEPTLDEWFEGTGVYRNIKYEESEYRYLQPSLIGSVFDDMIKFISVPVFRTRIMRMPSNHCYSIHKDGSPRLHLPIKTSRQAWFVFPEDNQVHHLPADGTLYHTDTTKSHSFMNGGEERIHIVCCIANPSSIHPLKLLASQRNK